MLTVLRRSIQAENAEQTRAAQPEPEDSGEPATEDDSSGSSLAGADSAEDLVSYPVRHPPHSGAVISHNPRAMLFKNHCAPRREVGSTAAPSPAAAALLRVKVASTPPR